MKSGKTAGPDCTYRVTDVIEGTEVQFQVLAENEAGVGHPSEPTDIVVIEDPTGMILFFITSKICTGAPRDTVPFLQQ